MVLDYWLGGLHSTKYKLSNRMKSLIISQSNLNTLHNEPMVVRQYQGVQRRMASVVNFLVFLKLLFFGLLLLYLA